MDLQAYQIFTESNQWGAIWPSLTLGLLALALLGLEMVMPRKHHCCIPRLAIAVQVVILVLPWITGLRITEERELFGGMILQTPLTDALRSFFLLCSIGVSYLGLVYLKKQQLPRIEFFHLVCIVTGAMLLLVQSNHFVMLFVALETVTVGFYVLVGYCRTSAFSLEAGLKYLILGGVSSAILLFGIVLLYGAAGNPELAARTTDGMHFGALEAFLTAHPDNIVALAGAALVIAGIAFKIGVVPFQIWIPDVYQGAPTPVTAFLAVASKAAGFLVLMNVVVGPLLPLVKMTLPLLSAIALVTILFGNMAAVPQQNVKRLMGLSGVAHAGYLLIGVIALLYATAQGDAALAGQSLAAVYFYLLTYLLGSFAVFGVMAHVATAQDERQELGDYRQLAQERPLLGGVLAIGLGSLAGIPPLAGFMGKLLLLIAAYKAGLEVLVAVAVVGVVISIYYYFGWVRTAFFKSTGEAEKTPAFPLPGKLDAAVLVAFAVATVILGIYQGGLGAWLMGL